RPASGDPRGERLASWTPTLGDVDDQKAYWERVTQTYRFPLDWQGQPLTPDRKYVLELWFEPPRGERVFAEPYVFEFKVDAERLRSAASELTGP
ncbi:MAG: hypothetical protein V3T70_10675, partial [Phycisphaerae bacterium]